MSDQDDIPTPRTDAKEFTGQDEWAEDNDKLLSCVEAYFARTLERELATVTRERDTARLLISDKLKLCAVVGGEDPEALAKLAFERDALRAEVENLKIWIDHTGFFCAGTDCHSVSDRALELLRGWKRNCMTAKARTAHPAGYWNCQCHGRTESECKCGAATAFIPEPSQVSGKDHAPMAYETFVLMKKAVEAQCQATAKAQADLAATQATIAELNQRIEAVEIDKEQVYLAVTLGAKLDEAQPWLRDIMEVVDQLRDELAALRAENERLVPDAKQAHARNDELGSEHIDLRAQLTTAIAERDEARKGRDTVNEAWEIQDKRLEQVITERDDAAQSASHMFFIVMGRSAEWSNTFGYDQANEEVEDALSILRQTLSSALAACAAKDDALREVMDHLSRHDSGVNHWREKEVSVIRPFPNNIHAYHAMRSTLSPTAGSDYVPKEIAENMRDALKKCAALGGYDKDGVYYYELGEDAEEAMLGAASALTAAAPFLTDSTGDEGK